MALQDITNMVPLNTKPKVIKRRLNDGTFKTYKYNSSRKQIDIVFNDETEKFKFESRLEEAKCNLGCRSVKETLIALVDQSIPNPNISSPKGHSSGHFSLSPNEHSNLSPNGHSSFSPNGHYNSSPNGHYNSLPNGHSSLSPNGHSNSSPNGHSN
jgi:hypothetical protein